MYNIMLDTDEVKYVCSTTYELKCERRVERLTFLTSGKISNQIPIKDFKNERCFTKQLVS